ncbi:hypothetical protein [Thermanaeromonas toyohensis]|nr:hypothetical protein [Thermanaeromonas toyohensis]
MRFLYPYVKIMPKKKSDKVMRGTGARPNPVNERAGGRWEPARRS